MKIRGMTLGQPVESGRLMAWPIYGPDHPGIGFVAEVDLAEDQSYGRMGFTSRGPGGGIGPAGMMFFMAGQDRALRESIWIPVGQKVYANTVCLEPSNGGLWKPGQNLTVKALPISLQAALPSGSGTGFRALWDDIEARHKANGKAGTTVAALLEGGSYLVPKDMVDPKARGAMLAIDGRIVAIEIAPTAAQFGQWWDEYGLSEAFGFDAQTLPTLPLPVGHVHDETISPHQDGMREITALDILKGWIYAVGGQIVYMSLLEKEGLTVFRSHGKKQEQDYQSPEPGDDSGRVEWDD